MALSNRVGIFKYCVGFLTPVILLPLPLAVQTPESKCGYVILLMAVYWVVEPIPVAATSLLPVVLFPLLGVLTTNEASSEYMNGTNMMFVGGLFMAVAIEECNLHKRIALNVLKWVGPTPSWMMFGFMSTSMFLSMWISNTATAALMVPIIEAVMTEISDKAPNKSDNMQLHRVSVVSASENSNDSHCRNAGRKRSENEGQRLKIMTNIKVGMFLSVAYSANIGGTGTLTGTGPNLVVKSVMERLFPDSNDLSFDKWMMFNVPVMLVCGLFAWGYLFVVFVRKASSIFTNELKHSLKLVIKKRHEELGPMTFQECAVGCLFLLLVFLWIFRDPQFIPGWASYSLVKISDATPAIAIPTLMFLIPKEPTRLGKSPALLTWKAIQQKVPWGVILLLGGGFALAAGSEKSGLSKWVTQQLLALNISSPLAIVSLICVLTAAITEFTSNVATANVLLPVVAELAVALRIHPIYMMLPVTISCSFAFMLPVATPPNAIVYEASSMKTLDMMKPGIFMNLVCIAMEVLMISTFGKLVFDLDHFPVWAEYIKMK